MPLLAESFRVGNVLVLSDFIISFLDKASKSRSWNTSLDTKGTKIKYNDVIYKYRMVLIFS